MNEKRSINIDALKGFLIILVVLGHAIQFIYSVNNFDNNFLWRIIYSFHMPLFMFISGYLSYSKNRQNDFKWIKKRFLLLVVPFFTWIIIDYFFKWQVNDLSIISKIKEVIIEPDKGYWFLLIVFYNCLVLYLSNIFGKKKQPIIYLILIGLVLMLPINKFGLILFKWHIVFFSFGYVLSRYKYFLIKYYKIIFYVNIIIFIVLVIFWRRAGDPTFITYLNLFTNNDILKKIILLGYKYVVPISGILLFFTLFENFKMDKIKNLLSIFSKYTLEIYILHVYLVGIIDVNNTLINTLISVIIGLFLPILITKIIEKNKLINKILFGK